MTPRDVPLGGPRAMRVRRTLPQRQRSLIGAWCFVDHYGPDRVADTGGMKVPPHPHTGLQTVSWLFEGEVEHRDSAGHHAMVRPGEVNLMTAGRGISHSEVSPASTTILHGAQLWVALPDAARHTDPGFEHHAPTPVQRRRADRPGLPRLAARGDLAGRDAHAAARCASSSSTRVRRSTWSSTPPTSTACWSTRACWRSPAWQAEPGDLALPPRPAAPASPSPHSDQPVRLLLLGGPPFGEPIVMWWNFVGRDHDEIVGYREEWQAQVLEPDGQSVSPDDAGGLREESEPQCVVRDGQLVRDGRFGRVIGDHLPPIPAPPLPTVRLRERR